MIRRAAAVGTTTLLCVLMAASAARAAIAFSIAPVVRDFHSTQTDFEIVNFSNSTPAAFFANDQTNKIEKGIAGPIGSSLNPSGLPVYSSTRDPGFYNTVSSATSYAAWFADLAVAVNTRVPGVTLPFTDNGDGTYTYSNTNFFPIDGQGFGNEGNGHNYHFTLQFHRPFAYSPGQMLSIISDDDSWIFVNKKLVVDAGGIHGTLGGTANLDTLGLTPGNVYDLDIFFAERNRFGAALILTSNFILPEPTAIWALLALPAIAMLQGGRPWRTRCT
jgi:fibro-slime domain-containing protein